MNTLILCDSLYGNTEQLARAVAAILSEWGPVRLVRAAGADAPSLDGVDLLVIGGPTHCHGPSLLLRRLLHRWPREVARHLDGLPGIAFDTRYRLPRLLSGSAARPLARRLRALGADLIAPPESFCVTRAATHEAARLERGELARSERWARAVPGRLAVRAAGAPSPAAALPAGG